METKNLTCIECPMGCSISVTIDGEDLTVKGNSCPRGKMYAENEVRCPMRVLTTTVKTDKGKMLPVKTDKPVQRSQLLALMKKVSRLTAKAPIKIGDVIVKGFSDGANLVATDNMD